MPRDADAPAPIPLTGARALSERYLRDEPKVRSLREAFASAGYVRLPGLLAPALLESIRTETRRLRAQRRRRDFRMPGYLTERRMSVLGATQVVRGSPLLAQLYADPGLRACLSRIVDAPLHTAHHDDEFLVINRLDAECDTHGWHLDDPRYAMVVVVEAPAAGGGGSLEYIPHWRRLAREHGFDPLTDVARGVSMCESIGACRRDHLQSGDCYLLDAAEVLHRVSPLSGRHARTAVNLAFDDRRYRVYGPTARALYG